MTIINAQIVCSQFRHNFVTNMWTESQTYLQQLYLCYDVIVARKKTYYSMW